MTKEENNGLATSELGLAAALLARGLKLTKLNGDDPLRLVFHFEGSNDEEDFSVLEASFFSGQLQVSALSFFQSLNRLKGLIRRRREET